MADGLELDGTPSDSVLELDAPATTSPHALLSKAGTLTGSLVQRGRERAPRLMETSMPMELPLPAGLAQPVLEAVPVLAPDAPERSRWSDVLFAAACCVAFFATFLFVLRF